MPLTTLRSHRALSGDDGRENAEAVFRATAEARAGGFDGLELDVGPLRRPPVLPEDRCTGEKWFAGVRAIRTWMVSRTVEDAIDGLQELFERLWGTEVGLLSMAIPPMEREPSSGKPRDYRGMLCYVAKVLQGVRRDAERAGIPLALDPCTGGCLLSPVELADLIDAAGTWAVGAVVDVERVAAVSRPADWIAALGRRVRGVRMTLEDTSLDRDGVVDRLWRLTHGIHERSSPAIDELFVIADAASPTGAVVDSRAEPIR
jgi:hypothetical protein